MDLYRRTRSIRLLGAAVAAATLTACSSGVSDTPAEAEETPSPAVDVSGDGGGSAYHCERVRPGLYC